MLKNKIHTQPQALWIQACTPFFTEQSNDFSRRLELLQLRCINISWGDLGWCPHEEKTLLRYELLCRGSYYAWQWGGGEIKTRFSHISNSTKRTRITTETHFCCRHLSSKSRDGTCSVSVLNFGIDSYQVNDLKGLAGKYNMR